MAALPPFTLECYRCGYQWDSTAKAGTSVKCPDCLSRGETHTRRMPAARPVTLAAARAAAVSTEDDGLGAAWDAETEPLSWRRAVGPAAGQDCRQCGAPMLWTGAHTAVVCLAAEHERAVWSVSADALRRSATYAAMLDKRANRTAAAIADPAAERAKRAETDRAALELAGRKSLMRDQLAALRSDKRLHPESRGALDWFDREVSAAATDERLDELAELLPEYVRRRHWWQADPLDVLEPDDYYDDQDDDHAEDGEVTSLGDVVAQLRAQLDASSSVVPGYVAPDPNWRQHISGAELTGSRVPRAAAGGQPASERRALSQRYGQPPCEQCLYGGNRTPPAAAARILYNDVREWDVCAGCEQNMTRANVRVEVIRRYGQAPPRRAIGGRFASVR